MKRRPHRARTVVAAALLALSAPAHADDLDQAKTFFNAGAQAYAAGKFPVAVQAFEEAYRLAPRPAILFSIAQAYRRQYYMDKKAPDLQQAIKYYREYVAKVEQGGRRADAAQALAELEPIATKLGADVAPAPPPQPKPQARVMVSSQTKGAIATLDGEAGSEVPLIREVKPGKHHVKVTEPGYFDEERDIVAVESGLVALDVPLRERPARLAIVGPSGAAITVDGRPVGVLPQAAQVEVAPGRHLVAVTKTGHKAFAQEIELSRGETHTLTANLPMTTQRLLSFGMIGVGIVGIGAAAVFGGLSIRAQNHAKDILDQHAAGPITPDQHDAYDAARTERDNDRRYAGVAAAAGGAVTVVGLLLYVFDQPTINAPAPRTEPTPSAPPRAPAESPMEMSAIPFASPNAVGASLVGRF